MQWASYGGMLRDSAPGWGGGAHLRNLVLFFMWLRHAMKPLHVCPQPSHSYVAVFGSSPFLPLSLQVALESSTIEGRLRDFVSAAW